MGEDAQLHLLGPGGHPPLPKGQGPVLRRPQGWQCCPHGPKAHPAAENYLEPQTHGICPVGCQACRDRDPCLLPNVSLSSGDSVLRLSHLHIWEAHGWAGLTGSQLERRRLGRDVPESHPCLISMRPRALDCRVDAGRVKPLGAVGMSACALHSRRMCILRGQMAMLGAELCSPKLTVLTDITSECDCMGRQGL